MGKETSEGVFFCVWIFFFFLKKFNVAALNSPSPQCPLTESSP